jgi:hypothetical protein
LYARLGQLDHAHRGGAYWPFRHDRHSAILELPEQVASVGGWHRAAEDARCSRKFAETTGRSIDTNIAMT